MLTFDKVAALVTSKPRLLLAAIGGLPSSGKTTSAQRPGLAPLHDLRAPVESDAGTALAAPLKRDVGPGTRGRRSVFLPGGAPYLRTDAEARADVAASGRGPHPSEPAEAPPPPPSTAVRAGAVRGTGAIRHAAWAWRAAWTM